MSAHENSGQPAATATYTTLLLSTLALSVIAEVLWMGHISRPPTTIYHLWHIALMLVVLGVRLAYQKHLAPRVARYTRLLIAGMVFCTAGDVINSAISGVEPITRKLFFAIFLFGAGYSFYVFALYHFALPVLRERGGIGYRLRWVVVAVTALANMAGWTSYVRPGVAGNRFLEVGSFIFNLTIYSLLIGLCVWYFWGRRLSLPALPVMVGGALLPISDLYLFHTWLAPDQNPAVPVFEFYAANWILYFGGQVLFALLPACENASAQVAAPAYGPAGIREDGAVQ